MAELDMATKNTLIADVAYALAHPEFLEDEYLVLLQENLAKLGYFEGEAYPNYGPKTAQAIADFYKDHAAEAGDAAEWVIDGLKKRGHFAEFSALPLTLHEGLENDPFKPTLDEYRNRVIADFLERDGASTTAQRLELQKALQAEECYTGKIDADIGPKTAEALVNYLKDSPDQIADLSGDAVMAIVEGGKLAHLKEFVKDDLVTLEAVQAKIKGLIGAPDLNEYSIKSLQGLMAITGHNPAYNIDGDPGSTAHSKTNQAIASFKADPSPQLGVVDVRVAFQASAEAVTKPPQGEYDLNHLGTGSGEFEGTGMLPSLPQ
jgi:peptidoglycan hydrolase-like protein with peptidoglycan-binding domain